MDRPSQRFEGPLHDRFRSAAAVLLIKAAQSWKKMNGGTLPSTSKERSAFKQLLSSWQHHIDGAPLEVRSPSRDVMTAAEGMS